MSAVPIIEKRSESQTVPGVPESYRASYVLRADENMFAGAASIDDLDVRRSIKLGEVPMPDLAPDEVLIAVMASAINFNTVWSSVFLPIPTFRFLEALGSRGGWDARHNQDYHQLGSDAAGIVAAIGSDVRDVKVGDHVVVQTGWHDGRHGGSQDAAVELTHLKAWGFETNFGGLADYAICKEVQVLPKPKHLTWEEAAGNALCLMTAYRMLIPPGGAEMKLGEIVFVWGATGGLGGYAIQLIRAAGGVAVGVVNSEAKANLLEKMGCDVILRRDQLPVQGLEGNALGKVFGKEVRRALGEDSHVVFEHVGRATFGASVYLARPGGRIVTCASSTGFIHEFDNRHLWMKVKRIIGSHGATSQEAREANRLMELGKIHPTVSKVYTLDDVAEAARDVQTNRHSGKVAVLCQAKEEGLGIEDYELRAKIGEDTLNMFRGVN